MSARTRASSLDLAASTNGGSANTVPTRRIPDSSPNRAADLAVWFMPGGYRWASRPVLSPIRSTCTPTLSSSVTPAFISGVFMG